MANGFSPFVFLALRKLKPPKGFALSEMGRASLKGSA